MIKAKRFKWVSFSFAIAAGMASAAGVVGIERSPRPPVKMPSYSAGSGWTGDSSLVYTGDRIQTPSSSVNVDLGGIDGGGSGKIPDLTGRSFSKDYAQHISWSQTCNPNSDHCTGKGGSTTCYGYNKYTITGARTFVEQRVKTYNHVRCPGSKLTQYVMNDQGELFSENKMRYIVRKDFSGSGNWILVSTNGDIVGTFN